MPISSLKTSLVGAFVIRSLFASAQYLTSITGGNLPPSNIPAVQSPMYPLGGCVDASGNIYFIDYFNKLVRKIDPSGLISNVAGSGIVITTIGNGVPATSTYVDAVAISTDANGNLFLIDSSCGCIRKVDLSTDVISTVVVPVGGGLSYSSGIYVDPLGNIFVTFPNLNVVKKIDANTGSITTIAGTGVRGFSGDGALAINATLSFPASVFGDAQGNLYVADKLNQRIRKIDAATQVITTFAGNNELNEIDNVPATSSALILPESIWIDSQGNVYVGGYNKIRSIDPAGIIKTVAGSGNSLDFSGDGALAVNAHLANPKPLGIKNGEFIVADFINHRIRKIDTNGIINTVAGNGFVGFFGNGGPVSNATSLAPFGSCFDRNGNLLIADNHNSCILKIDNQTNVISTLAGTGLYPFSISTMTALNSNINPYDVFVDEANNIFFTNQDKVYKVDNATGAVQAVAGNGFQGFNGDNIPALTSNLCPSSIWVDKHGNLFIADYCSPRIRKIDAVTKIITTVAGNGIAGYNGDGIPATQASLKYAPGVYGDGDGSLYIADYGNNRVRKVDINTGIISTIAGNGIFGSSGDGGLAVNASLAPTRVFLDQSKNIFVTDFSGVRRIDRCGVITRVAGAGNTVYNGSPIFATDAHLSHPFSAVSDASGNLFVMDNAYEQIYRIDANGNQSVTMNPVPSVTYGSTNTFSISATASSGLPVTYMSTNTTVASVDPVTGNITSHNAGTATIVATQPGNSTQYLPAVSGCQTLTVNKAPLSVTPIDVQREYGDPNPPLQFNYTGFVNGDGASVIDVAPVLDPTTVTQSSDVGTYPITVSGGSDNNYEFHYDIGSITITKAILDVQAEDKTKLYGDANPTLTLSYSGFKLNDNASVIDQPPMLSTTATGSSPVGSYPITLIGGMDNNYDFHFANGSLVVAVRAIDISAGNYSMVYGDPVPDINIQPPTGLSLSLTAQFSVTSLSEPGVYPVTLQVNGTDPNYIISLIPGAITVNKAPLNVTADEKLKRYGDQNPELTMRYEGFRNNETLADLDVAPSIETPANTFSPIGEYPITLSGGKDSHYDFILTNNTLTIECGAISEADVPNIVTPNGDGKNDVFKVSNTLIGSSFVVYNRWGDLVYSNYSYNNSWPASEIPNGIYYFLIRNHECYGDLKGWIQVLK